MQPLTWLALLSFHFANAEIHGICTITSMKNKTRYVIDRSKGTWIVQEYQEPVEHEECCMDYQMQSSLPLVCSPVCEPECEYAECMAPNTCVCYPGHQLINNSNTTCYDICDACVNGACFEADLECTCNSNYKRDETFKHICNPVCSSSCVNSTCTEPDVCTCFDGFVKHSFYDNICVPKCSESCVFGRCTAPEICTCYDGYINDKFSPSICMPICNHTCENGECSAPNTCTCRDMFELHPRNPFQCVPEAPENSYLNFCELNLPEAIKYDKQTDCFVIKDEVTIISTNYCQALKAVSQPACFDPNACNVGKCILNFRCSIKKFNDSSEIHCNFETDDFETESRANIIINGTEWTNATLIVNFYQPINSSVNPMQNHTHEWLFRPLHTWPVCGQMHFAVEICASDRLVQPTFNTSVMTWINVFLILGFLLLVGAGAGGFLWVRHRRLKDPLNYREDMIRGYYNNECYDNQPVDLVSDDDSDHDLNAPL